MRNTTPPALPH